MMSQEEIQYFVHSSVLCWLATSNEKNEPNVSPKEMFVWSKESTLLIAHIASPQSVKNIKENSNVCVSLLDIFRQKGVKLKGLAKVIFKEDLDFGIKLEEITAHFSDKYPIKAIIEVQIKGAERILAPSYLYFPEITEESQVASTMSTYGVKPI